MHNWGNSLHKLSIAVQIIPLPNKKNPWHTVMFATVKQNQACSILLQKPTIIINLKNALGFSDFTILLLHSPLLSLYFTVSVGMQSFLGTLTSSSSIPGAVRKRDVSPVSLVRSMRGWMSAMEGHARWLMNCMFLSKTTNVLRIKEHLRHDIRDPHVYGY